MALSTPPAFLKTYNNGDEGVNTMISEIESRLDVPLPAGGQLEDHL